MCGIAGSFALTKGENNKAATELIQKILLAQHARGPDHQGIIQIKSVPTEIVFGHNRLRIVDLDNRSDQPMRDSNQLYSITYNGEIYNYQELRLQLHALGRQFATLSDTEVILAAYQQWGIDCLQYFNGMFAFALFDIQKNKLFLVRDRFGVKPLYYHINPKQIVFASSSKTLADHFHLKPNLNFISKGLHYRIYEDDSSITSHQNLYAVPAGCYLEVFLNNKQQLEQHIVRYYQFRNKINVLKDSMATLTTNAIKEKIFETLNDAVVTRLHADVPVAVSLSGGLDSTLIAALAKKHKNSLVGFTFGEPLQNHSEGPQVERLAQTLGIKVHYIWPSQQEISQSLDAVLAAQQAPFPSGSILAQYFVYQRVKQEEFKVLLGGQGCDEAFMGYRKFYWLYLQQQFAQKNIPRVWQAFGGFTLMLLAEIYNIKKYWQQRARYFKHQGLKSVLQLPTQDHFSLSSLKQNKDVNEFQIADVLSLSLLTLLRYEDRNSMAHSIESRLPFLDYRLMELASALPMTMKLNRGYGKWILREISEGLLPNFIRLKRIKRGFDVAQEIWVNNGLGTSIRAELNERKNILLDFLPSQTSIEQLFSDNQLAQMPQRFAEAITLLWLAKNL